DTFAWCSEQLPNWNSISVSGYHMREAGASAAQEIGFTLANGRAYVKAALDAGMDIDNFAPRISFFFASHSNLLEEVAKFRAARRMWARMMREEFGAKDPKSWMLRFHTQTGGVTLTAQQPLNNVVRTSLQALSAVLGGTQSLHTNGYDEALALPTEESATLALRTQQIISLESGVADTADPLAGSYYVEAMTDELESKAQEWIEGVDDLGGAVSAIEAGYVQNAIAENAYRRELAVDAGEIKVVGVNAFVDEHDPAVEILSIDQHKVDRQIERVKAYKAAQDRAKVDDALVRLRETAAGETNLLPVIKSAFEAGATLGQAGNALRDVFGEYRARS
ncbi:MAG: methylmalonyl-CoA mutase, partial [Thermomicrobiales bacterium]|nr:methylmalonyl-CoA mutase [Thermomicrobiales bacterium]